MHLDTAALTSALLASTTTAPRPVPRAVVAVASRSEVLFEGASGPTIYTGSDARDADGGEGGVTADSIFWLASCSKLVTCIAALQLLERGKFTLESDAEAWVPELRDARILKGFDEDGEEVWEEKKGKVTIKQLFTMTAGFTYSKASETHERYRIKHGIELIQGFGPTTMPRTAVTKLPMAAQPGSTFIYGPSNDWLGFVVEAVSGMDLESYLQKHVFSPLNITDMTFTPSQAHLSSLLNLPDHAPGVPGHTVSPPWLCFTPESAAGGGGLFGSPKSYLKILRTILNDGVDPDTGAQLLKRATVETMFAPQIEGEKVLKELNEALRADNDPWSRSELSGGIETVEEVKERKKNWGLGGALNVEGFEDVGGRRKGSMFWAGYSNTYWWIDREADITALVWIHTVPSPDPALFDLWEIVEKEIYKSL